MSIFNAALRSLLDLINSPLEGCNPMWGVFLWSIPVALFALIVFKKASNQERITATKDKIFGCLFEIRLFNDDLMAILRAQIEILRHVVTYQRLSLVPMFWILPPMIILMVHLHTFYGYRGMNPGEEALLKVDLSESWASSETIAGSPSRPPISLELPDGLSATTETVWLEALNQVVWRIRADTPGSYEMKITLGDADYSKSVSVTEDIVRLSFERPNQGFLGQLEFPGEAPLPASSPIDTITLTYQAATMSLLGLDFEWEFAWMVYFFIFTMIIAFALRKRMGVEF